MIIFFLLKKKGYFVFIIDAILSECLGALKKSGSPKVICSAPWFIKLSTSDKIDAWSIMRNLPWYTAVTGQCEQICAHPLLVSIYPLIFSLSRYCIFAYSFKLGSFLRSGTKNFCLAKSVLSFSQVLELTCELFPLIYSWSNNSKFGSN